jgi:hypothetical protein
LMQLDARLFSAEKPETSYSNRKAFAIRQVI